MNITKRRQKIGAACTWCAIALAVGTVSAAEVAFSLSGSRTKFAISEPVEFSIAAADGKTLEIRHADGSVVSLQLPAQQGPISIRPATLKPGEYTATIGDKSVKFSVHDDQHANAYFTGQWVHHGGTAENALAKAGWMFMNTDYVGLHPRAPQAGDLAESYVAGASKPYTLMVLGGGHQLDLQMENDWGDPWVQRAIVWRMQLSALSNRIYPIAGHHVFDEPGLTWWPTRDAAGKQIDANPFAIPHQVEEFKKLTGKDIPVGLLTETFPKYAPMMDDWLAFAELRMKYLEQAWWASVWGAKSVAPKFNVVNQVSSSYAPHDVTDGVDSRQNRPYEIISGHGQYSDMPFGTLQPLRAAESFWGFGWDRPHVYLPMWYTHSWATIRNAVWVSWASKLDGMLYTPEQEFGFTNQVNGYIGSNTIFEIAEINRRMALVGDTMSRLKKTLSPVAVLQSHTQVSWDTATENHPKPNPIGPYYSKHRDAVGACFFRVLETGLIPNCIDEAEVVEKGPGFLKQWKVIFCPALNYATPPFRRALEDYAAGGGKLIQFETDKLVIPGAVVVDHAIGNGFEHYQKNIVGEKDLQRKAINGSDLVWRTLNNAGAPNFAAELAEWLGPLPYGSSNRDVLLGVHQAGDAHYLLLANNAQSKENPRFAKHELVPAETALTLPAGGVVYDLFNGGLANSKLKLAAGDGACLLHLPEAPGEIKLTASLAAGNRIQVDLAWGKAEWLLPFRLRIYDPAGNKTGDYYRAAPFRQDFPLGNNAALGNWKIRVDEWLTGRRAEASIQVNPPQSAEIAHADTDKVSIYFDDAQRIANLFAGKASEPPWEKINWDAKRAFNLDPKKFAVFGDATAVEKIAAALRAKGMTVEVNPKFASPPFKREPNRGGVGPHYSDGNFENIYAHAIVLPGHPLAEQSWKRGHINRPLTSTFPGQGRAFLQWGSSCYQAGWQNVFAFGDTDAAVDWLLAAINGKLPSDDSIGVQAKIIAAKPTARQLTRTLKVERELRTYDTPVGVEQNADGSVTYMALHDGSVAAYDKSGKPIWNTQVLLEGCALALSPKGDRLAIAGYPGLQVLDATTGKMLGGYKSAPKLGREFRMVCVDWNGAGTKVAGGWVNDKDSAAEPVAILDANGKDLQLLNSIPGNVYGIAFAPNSDTLLVGADKLTAMNASDGKILWTTDLGGAQSFAFSADGQTAAAGGWGKKAGKFNLTDGKMVQSTTFDAVIGGVAFLPSGDLAIAVWGGTKPLFVLRTGKEKPESLLQSRFGFQNVIWSNLHKNLVAAEQGGRLWFVGSDGGVHACLDDEAGTTAYRLIDRHGRLLVSRMNRVVQSITAPSSKK